ncbi:hypothetical protein RUM44_009643 [Polyplax serrata]|uniref:HEAT repeat-containing protein 1 n=1 Tax=Polyplax serrata TaxID=468196 RepID=A0ABR1AT95_POLSC
MEKGSRKNNNRFKFIPFSERISNVNIDVFHRVPHPFEEESAEEFTYFHLALRKWTVLNLTGKWKAFRKEIGYNTQTLPQLLNSKEKIIDAFLQNIRLQDELSLQPVLELMVALVKDLRHEFYPFYSKILKELLHLLKFKDPDVLESTFTCLAYIYKYLFRELVKDLDKVLLDLVPLLNENNPDYVRDFAAQSFSFVARKVKDKEKLLSLVLYAVQTSPQISLGCSQLLFEMMKGIKGQTHSCAEELLCVLFSSLGKKDVPQKILFPLSSQIVTNYGNCIAPQHSILFNVILKNLKTKLEKDDLGGVIKLLRITRIALTCQSGGHLVESCLPEMVQLLVKCLSLETKIQSLASGICADMLNLRNLKMPQEFASRLITKVFQLHDTSILVEFVSETSNSFGFESSILGRAFQALATSDSHEFLHILTNVVVDKTKNKREKLDTFPVYPLMIHQNTKRIFDFTLEAINNFTKDNMNLKNLLCSLILIRHFDPIDRISVTSLVLNFVKKLVDLLKSTEEKEVQIFLVLCGALETLLYFKNEYGSSERLDSVALIQTLVEHLKNDKSLLVLKCLDLFLTLEHSFLSLEDDLYDELNMALENWLLAPQTNCRIMALHTLQKLEESKSKNSAMIKTLQIALEAELISPTVLNYRDKIMLLEKLNFEGLAPLTEEKHKVSLNKIYFILPIVYHNKDDIIVMFSFFWNGTL